MLTTPENGNGTVTLPEAEATRSPEEQTNGVTARVVQRLLAVPPDLYSGPPRSEPQPVLAVFCHEEPGSAVTQFLARVLGPLARRHTEVHVYARKAFELDAPGALIHVLGDGEGDLIQRIQCFTDRACNAFLKRSGTGPVTLLGCEWSSVPALSLLRGLKNHNTVLSLHSLERQRSDLGNEVSRRIEEIELTGLREARSILVHDAGTAEVARLWAPECATRIIRAREVFPVQQFNRPVDPGAVKARYQIGPVDPVVLYVGDLDERYGPDLLLKAMPAVLKENQQVRLIVAGDGSLQWPLRVYSRYLLLDHAVRLAGHVDGDAMYELVQAAEVIAVPSREATPWWPILAGWAAKRPVVATHEAAPGLLEHEQDSLLVYPEPASCAWGIDRVLSDPELARATVRRGSEKLDERLGWGGVAAQVEELMGVAASR